MTRILLCILVLSALPAFSQQSPQGQDSPQATPSTAPGNIPSQSLEVAPSDQTRDEANTMIENSIQDVLSSDPILDGVDVQASVNDQSITLTGTVESYAQHERVLELVSSYGRWRAIDDRVRMR
jgi:hypothetical protein